VEYAATFFRVTELGSDEYSSQWKEEMCGVYRKVARFVADYSLNLY
jgi:hypothetical protein